MRSLKHTSSTLLQVTTLAFLVVTLLFTSCKKDEEPEPQQANRAPGEFIVTPAPDLNSVLISWTASTDPDGDGVSYMLILEDDTLLQASTVTFLEVMDLEFEAPYTGSVIALDPAGLTLEKAFSFTTGVFPNQAPLDFNLLSPVGGSDGLVAPITFTWQQAIDPDGDTVTYEFIIDESPDPQTSFATGISTTTFTHDGTGLENGISYYWRVIAHDGNGGQTLSSLGLITMNNPMTLATDDPGWADRYGHTVTEFNGKMWLIGGIGGGSGHLDDIWSSEDGETWTEEVADAPFSYRAWHGATVFDDKLWIVGGQSSFGVGNEFADVWYTEDGVNWTEATADGGFEPRDQHVLLSYNGKLWVLGGTDEANTAGIPSSVWSSSDGVNWIQDSTGEYFNPSGKGLVFDGKMWFLGGFSAVSKWSTDGINWNVANANSEFGERIYPSVTAHDGKMWLLSGSDNLVSQFYEFPDIWSSDDGITWTEVSGDAGFAAVAFGQALSFDDKLWLLGGGGGFGDIFVTNDVWFFE